MLGATELSTALPVEQRWPVRSVIHQVITDGSGCVMLHITVCLLFYYWLLSLPNRWPGGPGGRLPWVCQGQPFKHHLLSGTTQSSLGPCADFHLGPPTNQTNSSTTDAPSFICPPVYQLLALFVINFHGTGVIVKDIWILKSKVVFKSATLF